MPTAPGVTVSISTAPPSPNSNVSTGTWFVVGQTQAGPTGVAVPITSMTDYANYLGTRVSYGYLYDSLNEFFNDGGSLAYVSRIVGPSAAQATRVLQDNGGSPQNTLKFWAYGEGTWGNSLTVQVTAGTASNSYVLTITNTVTGLVTASPNLFSPTDAVTWANALNPWQVQVYITNLNSTNSAPSNNPAVTGPINLAGGTDDTADVSETQWANALSTTGTTSPVNVTSGPGGTTTFQNFPTTLGPGQVSAPGHTTSTGYQNLANHAYNNTRVALLDVADSSVTATLTAQAAYIQAGGTAPATDPSYAAMFAPWLIIPGIFSTNPGASSPVPNRTIPPSALAAALMARNDLTNDANVPAAGTNGRSLYVIGTTQTYSAANLGTLNAAGVNIIRSPYQNSGIQLYGYRSLATDPNWTYLNWVRFRMQVVNALNAIAENFVFAEIDGRGQVFARLNGAIAGQCQQWWLNGSLYGANSQNAYQVNTGPQVNTPTTIAAAQINVQVLLRFSPLGEMVNVSIIKYLSNQALPGQTS